MKHMAELIELPFSNTQKGSRSSFPLADELGGVLTAVYVFAMQKLEYSRY